MYFWRAKQKQQIVFYLYFYVPWDCLSPIVLLCDAIQKLMTSLLLEKNVEQLIMLFIQLTWDMMLYDKQNIVDSKHLTR